MIRMFLIRCNIYRRLIYYLMFAISIEVLSFVHIVLSLPEAEYTNLHLKYEEPRRNIVYYLRKEICFSEYVYTYIENEAADMQLKSAASGPVSRQGWTTLWKEGAFILRKEIYGTRVVCHQRVGGCILFLCAYALQLQGFSSGETCIFRRDTYANLSN